MHIHPAILVLPSCLLERDKTGQRKPAEFDRSGGALYGQYRFDAARILAKNGVRFKCVGSRDQTEYLLQELPGGRHIRVFNPDRFSQNTQGNIAQLRELSEDPSKEMVLPNLYYAYRWYEWTGAACLPAEAVLTAHYGWGHEKLTELYGNNLIGRRLLEITFAAAHRINTGRNGCLTESELRMFDDILSQLPHTDATGPARENIPEHIKQLIDTPYAARMIDELCGVKDLRAGTYKSFV